MGRLLLVSSLSVQGTSLFHRTFYLIGESRKLKLGLDAYLDCWETNSKLLAQNFIVENCLKLRYIRKNLAAKQQSHIYKHSHRRESVKLGG